MSSLRRTVRDEVFAALQAVPELARVTTGIWSGSVEDYNPDAVTPSVWLASAGLHRGDLSRPGSLVGDVDFYFSVLVETDDRTAPDGDGEGQALDLLEAVEDALSDRRLPTRGFLFPLAEEEAVRAELGSHLFLQTYAVRLAVTK